MSAPHAARKGEANPNVKLTELKVHSIRKWYEGKHISMMELARVFHISKTQIRRIITRQNWSNAC